MSTPPLATPLPNLKAHLDALLVARDPAALIASDPVRVVHRYPNPQDAEIAAFLASQIAYGGVRVFLPVLDRLLAVADAAGGPRRFVEGFDAARDGPALAGLGYRWTRGTDWTLLLGALQRLLTAHGTVEALFSGDTARDAITSAGGHLRAAGSALLADAGEDLPLPRGFLYCAVLPAGGSACKRANLLLRWMVRPADGVDLGLWHTLSPRDLIIPVDRHVGRIAALIGLVPRATATWRSAEAITTSLRHLCPDDPTKYDFAIAHVGISSGCRGAHHAQTCGACPLRPCCVHGTA